MKQYDTGDLRNLAVVGHGASGKTTLVEAMLVLGKEINRMGTIETGTTVSDYHPGEKERQISIHSTPLHMEWDQKKFNIIDAPGYSDFIGESISSLAVVDMAVGRKVPASRYREKMSNHFMYGTNERIPEHIKDYGNKA